MDKWFLFNLMPSVTSHAFYSGKASFMLPEDRYPEWVILAAEEGSFWYHFEKQEGTAAFGDLVICPPNTVLRRKALETLSYHFILFSWRAIDTQTVKVDELRIPTGKITINDTKRLAMNFQYIRKAFESNDPYSRRKISQLLFDIWYLYCTEANPPHPFLTKAKVEDPLIEELATLMRENAFQTVVIKKLAGDAGLSPVQFTRRFQAAFGTTPINYINTIRLQKAQSLLLETNLNLQQIAESCGYDNGFYFSRIFKRKLGVSPSQFRKMNQI